MSPAPNPPPLRLLYLYGISPGGDVPKLPVTGGVDGYSRVEALPCGDFLCWISRVDEVEFGAELQSNMENLDWLATAGVQHQKVVGEIAARVTILPARFGTVFASDQSLCEDVKGRAAELKEAFARLEGCDEWGVKVFLIAPEPAAMPAATSAASGAEYLRKKAAALQQPRASGVTEDVRAFAEELDAIASDSAPSGKVSGAQRDLEWQATFLLPRKKRKQWDAVLKRYAEQWGTRRRIECTGPWPPYSFVEQRRGR